MCIKDIPISDAELEIMKVIWSADGEISSAEITEAVLPHGWKRTTVATFLARLSQKGAVYPQKRGKTMYYIPLVSSGEYKKSQLKSFIKNVFDGSTAALVASLFEEKALSDKDAEELRAIFERQE